MFKKSVMHGNSLRSRFGTRLDYHQFSLLLSAMSNLAYGNNSSSGGSGLPQMFAYSDSTATDTATAPEDACLTKYLRIAHDKARSLLADRWLCSSHWRTPRL